MCHAQSPTERAATALTQLMRWYDAREGQFSGIGWWHTGNALTTLCENGLYTSTSTYNNIVSDMYTKNQNFTTEGYDDEGWWGLAWLECYALTNQKNYLALAESVYSDLVKAWDTTCGGGVWWDRRRTYKNAITNELFLSMSTKLYLATKNTTYLSWAQQEWKWFEGSSMINAQYLINDGIVTSTCKNNGQTVWTYNQGVVLGGLVDLYEVTRDNSFLVAASRIANATISSMVTSKGILQEGCEPRNCDGDQIQFKGIFMRNLGYLYKATSNSYYGTFIQKNADSIWSADRSGSMLGFVWSGPFDAGDAARQSSALDALNAAILVKQRAEGPKNIFS
eukprot:TRINITY_DN2682_c0_g1_i2.p1 TRINITY_DN2682_c0_g1~~TRINITY_DN2682_c0_g1_i2.p1  ORF type:complete len:358 (-),score=28.40 TRINITY_DN2682_c0_g1_i2:87-1097(-)